MRLKDFGALFHPLLQFDSDQGDNCSLKLMQVLYVQGLARRLFSIESFVSGDEYEVTYRCGEIKVLFENGVSCTIALPHNPPSGMHTMQTTLDTVSETALLCTHLCAHDDYSINSDISELSDLDEIESSLLSRGELACATEELKLNNLSSLDDLKFESPDPNLTPQPVMNNNGTDDQANGGEIAPLWSPTMWYNLDSSMRKRKRVDVKLLHTIFGHRSVASLMAASRAKVWDDVEAQFSGDSWCQSCNIAVAPKQAMSKRAMRFTGGPLQNLFVDVINNPQPMMHVPECRDKYHLFIVDPISRYAEKLRIADKTTSSTIKALSTWRGNMIKKGYDIFLHLRADAGTNFTSEEFKSWCSANNVELSIAAPKHQEQNAFAERTYQTVCNMAQAMLVHAHLGMGFHSLALSYACKILRVLPGKNLVDKDGKLTTTYAVLHGRKPRIFRYKVFGCPVVFKRYQPMKNGKALTNFQQVQQGSRGIFVGFPPDQAGWLIYVEEKISGTHLVCSMDVVFDQNFLSGISASKLPFDGAIKERNLGRPSRRPRQIKESTGDITNITNSRSTHWGSNKQYEVEHDITKHNNNEREDSVVDDDDNTTTESLSESEDLEHFEVDSSLGTTFQNGMRRSTRRSNTLDNKNDMDLIAMFASQDLMQTLQTESHYVFEALEAAAENEDIDVTPYLPEPRNWREVMRCPENICNDWIKAIKKETKNLVELGTFKRGEIPREGDEILPGIFIFKAKLTSRGFLDKCKARCVARGDLEVKNDGEDVWSPCVQSRSFKMFVAFAVHVNRVVKQLDFIGAFLQGK